MASQSLQTQMAGVEVAGQNLANVNTPGYARQQVQIQTAPDIDTSAGPEGTGAEVSGIDQVVNQFLNSQVQSQQSTSGYWNAQQSALQSAQTSLGEFLNGTGSTSSTSSSSSDGTTSTGLSAQLSSLFSAFQSLAASPTSATAQQNVVDQAQSLTSSLNQVDSQLGSIKDQLNESLGNDVSSANSLLSGIASLNSEITSAQFDGGNANDLLDAREQDLENLSQLADVQTSTGSGGELNVTIGGQTLVSGGQVLDTMQTYDAGGGQMLVQTATGGVPLTLTGGSIQGTIDARDGALATLQNGVNNLASTLITQVNSVYSAGYSSSGTTGDDFFTGSGSGDIAVNASLVNNPGLMQTSGTATATGDNTIALQLGELGTSDQGDLDGQTFSGSYDETVAGLGDALNSANEQVSNQTSVLTMLQTQQSDVSGVNVDEEMTSLMGFQHAYEASAQLVTTINTMMGDLLSMKST